MYVMGGDSMTKFYPVERALRDAKVSEIAGGTNDVLRLLPFREGTALMARELKPPKRMISPKLGMPVEAPLEKVPKFSIEKPKEAEDKVLEALAENYRVNLGLWMTPQDLKDVVPGLTDELLEKVASSLEQKGYASIYRDRKGVLRLVKPTYAGLRKIKPLKYFQYFPPFVKSEEAF